MTQSPEPLVVRTIDSNDDENAEGAMPASFGQLDLTPARYEPLNIERLDAAMVRRHFSAQTSRIEWLANCKHLTPTYLVDVALERVHAEIVDYFEGLPELLGMMISELEAGTAQRSINTNLLPAIEDAMQAATAGGTGRPGLNLTGGRYGGMTGQNKPGASIGEADKAKQTTQAKKRQSKARKA